MSAEDLASMRRPEKTASRERILHLLAEAAELEHNILCSYLYAAFSLKRRKDEGVSAAELAVIERWRGEIIGLCIEEMVHLAQVCNLTVALGARPHLNRPNLPNAPGYHPQGVTIALVPFGLEALEHFIFLERPSEIRVRDPEIFQDSDGAHRPQPTFRHLTPHAPDYGTIGEFYDALRFELAAAAQELGEPRLFIGPTGLQITPEEIHSPDLVVVGSAADADRAIDFIVDQGEGSGGSRDGSHFGRFEAMRDELLELRAARADFEPARAAARNPVMRAPTAEDRVWIDSAQAAPVVDAANATYWAMLRCLAQVYETPASQAAARQAFLTAAISCMKATTALGSLLTELPAREEQGSPRAGMSFAMPRATEGFLPEQAWQALAERLAEIARGVAALSLAGPEASAAADAMTEATEALRRA